jgi:hypothetical protein
MTKIKSACPLIPRVAFSLPMLFPKPRGSAASPAHFLLVSALFLLLAATTSVRAQTPASAIAPDARTGLKAGLYDAGVAALNVDLVVSIPSPPGFYEPQGLPMPPGLDLMSDRKRQPGQPSFYSPRDNRDGGPDKYAHPGEMTFSNSDLAFGHNRVVTGGYHGFSVYDVSDHDHPKLSFSVVCPGGQGDVSIYGNLVFVSVEQNGARIDCGTNGTQQPPHTDTPPKEGAKHPYIVDKERFKGLRIFDISNPSNPRQVAAVQTCRGSHTNTLIPDPHDPRVLYVYISSTAAVRPAEEMAGCSDAEPAANPETSLYSIDIIKVSLDAPQNAAIVAHPRLFTDSRTGAIDGLWKKGDHGPGSQKTFTTDMCHDITAFPELGLAAGACAGNGLLLDISDPMKPSRIDAVTDPNFIFWHTAIFSNDGSKVVFTDEWSSGIAPRCRQSDPPKWGADLIFSIHDRKLVPRAYYKLPGVQGDTENCVAHNGGIIPVPGRDILVQGWYSGGTSVMDFTDPAHPKEIAYFDRGPVNAKEVFLGGHWASYWYNGRIYAAEIARGLDVLKLKPSSFLTRNEIAAAELVVADDYNAQSQRRIQWPDSPVVARAYLDQLIRATAIQPSRAAAVSKALDQLEHHSHPANLPTLANELNTLATTAASPRNADRFRGIAHILAHPAATGA